MANIIEIKNFEAPELDIYARQSENQLRLYMNPKPAFLLQKVRK